MLGVPRPLPRTHPGMAELGALGHRPLALDPHPVGPGQGCTGHLPGPRAPLGLLKLKHSGTRGSGSLPRLPRDRWGHEKRSLWQPGSLTPCTILGAQLPVAQSRILPLGRKGRRQETRAPLSAPKGISETTAESSWLVHGLQGREWGERAEGTGDGGEGRAGQGRGGRGGQGGGKGGQACDPGAIIRGNGRPRGLSLSVGWGRGCWVRHRPGRGAPAQGCPDSAGGSLPDGHPTPKAHAPRFLPGDVRGLGCLCSDVCCWPNQPLLLSLFTCSSCFLGLYLIFLFYSLELNV